MIDNRFKAEFPANPKESSEEIEVANNKIEFQQLSADDQDSQFAVSYIDYPSHWNWIGSKKLLTKAFNGFLEGQKGVEEVLENEITTHHGQPALAYRIKQNGKEVQGKFVIAGNTLYRVAVTYPLAAVEKIKPQNFINSFEILG